MGLLQTGVQVQAGRSYKEKKFHPLAYPHLHLFQLRSTPCPRRSLCTRGTMCPVHHKYFAEKSIIHTREVQVHARKVPLTTIHTKLLKKHQQFMQLFGHREIELLSHEEAQALLQICNVREVVFH